MATESGRDRSALSAAGYWVERLSETQFAYLMLAPAFALVAVFAVWPLVETFQMSLHADSLLGQGYVGEFVGFQTY